MVLQSEKYGSAQNHYSHLLNPTIPHAGKVPLGYELPHAKFIEKLTIMVVHPQGTNLEQNSPHTPPFVAGNKDFEKKVQVAAQINW